jgi:hypothetical protein
LRGDGAADVTRVALAAGILDVQPDRVQLNGEILDVGLGKVSEGRNVSNRDRFFPFVGLVFRWACFGLLCRVSTFIGDEDSETIAPAESIHRKAPNRLAGRLSR